MMNFLKSFFSGEKTVEEQAILATVQKPHDVLKLDAYAMGDEEEQQGGGCGGCSCGNGGCG